MPSKTKPAAAKKAKAAPKNPSTLVTFLLDRSGSMGSCRGITIEAFNTYLNGLKEETKADISFTLLQFDDQSLDKCCVNESVKEVPGLTLATYVPRGFTPLIDAAVKTIQAVDAALKTRDDKPKIVVCIQTDGAENRSREHTWEELKELVTAKTAEGWEFNFMGAGIEGYDQAAKMGIAAVSTMSYDSRDWGHTQAAFAASAQNTRSFSRGLSKNMQYSVSDRMSAGDAHFGKWLGGDPQIVTPRPAAAQIFTAKIDLTVKTPETPKPLFANFKL